VVGVEEEFLLVDPVSRLPIAGADAVAERAATSIPGQVSTEFTRFQIEAKTTPCSDSGALSQQLRGLRRTVAEAAAGEGLRIVATGTPVFGDVVPPPINEHPRYARGMRSYGPMLHDEQSICACHVHVQLPDRARAVLVSNHLRPWLPVLVALAANSPYWAGRDTGYSSWRTVTWGRWPVAGPPPYFTSLEEFDDLVADLTTGEVLVDPGTIFWDIRPSARFPTLEIRAADVALTVDESVLLATLVRALVVVSLAAVAAGDPGPEVSAAMLRAAYWRAARDGMEGSGIDVRQRRLVPGRTLVQAMVEHARPGLSGNDAELVDGCLDRLFSTGTGAARQRAAFERRGRFTDVVDYLIDQTLAEH
jgi:carboxylate-amine ligase